MALIESLGANVRAVTVALDRQEKGQGERSAIQELESGGLQVVPIIRLADIMAFLEASGDETQLAAITAYRERYGIAD
jgi:orotate phosphoribosyltransferase